MFYEDAKDAQARLRKEANQSAFVLSAILAATIVSMVAKLFF